MRYTSAWSIICPLSLEFEQSAVSSRAVDSST
nr:MAG TPA: hypothetical protein [Caudoviricetes sp.]DAS96358.1 MAG TPA: hypothetical protein [Caudoviricetes sp.]DAV47322.1 MAG TPA: hypothetical protein [Caudoviricetes sp.]DAW08727.1 MAG TPA: hypothetical protein [Caudoviricetes sp.]